MTVDVDTAVRTLARGEVLAYPTETVYGLGVDACSPAALARLRSLKGREPDRGLSVLVSDADELNRRAPDLPEAAKRLAARFWPGPLTLVLPVDKPELREVATDLGVGFRCSSQPSAAALARGFDGFLVSTSCNKSGAPPCETAAQVRQVFGDELAVLGGEDSGRKPPSTVVSIDAAGKAHLLREGATPFSDVLEELK